MEEELVNVVLLVLVLPKFLRELSGDCHLLALQEALKQHVDCEVNIIRAYMVSQVHSGISFAHPEHTLDVSDRDLMSTNRVRLTSDVLIKVGDLIGIALV